MTHEEVARVCHEATRAWCQVNGDDSQKPWDLAEEWQRRQAIEEVRFIAENVGITAQEHHDAWAAAKLRDGWRYGKVKDAQEKTHPCLLPFSQLFPPDQAKARIFKAICGALLGD